GRRVPQAYGEHGFQLEAARPEILPRHVRLRALAQLPCEPVGRRRNGVVERFVGVGAGGSPLGDRDPHPAGHFAHGGRIIHAEALHEELEDIACLVAHEAVEHPLFRNDGEVAVRAAVERARATIVGPAALELDVLPDDTDQIGGLADLVDDVVGDQTHAVNSTIVTPWPPWLAGAKPKRFTRGSAESSSCTSLRTAPVPLPWITRRYGRSAATASSKALTSTGSASSKRRPRSEISLAAVAVGRPAPIIGLGGRRGAPGGSCLGRRNSASDSHLFPFPPSPAFSPAVSPAVSPVVSSIACSKSRLASRAVASSTAARARPSASSTLRRASSR